MGIFIYHMKSIGKITEKALFQTTIYSVRRIEEYTINSVLSLFYPLPDHEASERG